MHFTKNGITNTCLIYSGIFVNSPLENSIARGFDSQQFHFSASVAEGLGTGLIIRSTLVQVQSDVI